MAGRLVVLIVCMVFAAACSRDAASSRTSHVPTAGPRPDEWPAVLNTDLPFRYPAALYARKVQGNVTLRLSIDRDGHVLADSTRIEEPSGVAAFDSAALAGARELRFVPAKLRGEAVPATVLFPVFFRHPEAPALPGDTVLGAGRAGLI